MISQEKIDTFRQEGFIVVEGVLTPDEVSRTREAFHRELLDEFAINHEGVLNQNEILSGGIRVKSGISNIFYSKWKLLDVHLHPLICRAMKELHLAIKDEPSFHPPQKAGPYLSDETFAFIDRVCYRTPDNVRAEGGLGLHLDYNPGNPLLAEKGKVQIKKYRPLQALVTLTDHYGGESGGLKVVHGFHKELDAYFAKDLKLKPDEKGEFFRMHSKSYAALQKRCEPVQAPAGSLICWSFRLPHATCEKLSTYDTREVVYTGFLPDVQINRVYIQKQLENLRKNKAPPAFQKDTKDEDLAPVRSWSEEILTGEQKNMLGFSLKKNKSLK